MRSVFCIGPIVTREGSATHLCVAWSREAGTELASGPDRLSALRQLIDKVGASELVCDPALEEEARQVGLVTAPLSPEVIEVRAGISVTVDHGPLLREAGPAVVELIRAASELARAAPWNALPPAATFELTVGGKVSTYAAVLTSDAGKDRGVVLVAPDQRLGVFLQTEPAFVAEAVEALTGVRAAPHVIHTRGTEVEPIPAESLATLVAATRAIIDLGTGSAVGRGSCWAPRKTEVTARVRQVIPKVGRNDLCPCGSGRKYKRCHGGASA